MAPSMNRSGGNALVPKGMFTCWSVLFVVWMIANSSMAWEVALTGGAITLAIAHAFASASAAWGRVNWTPSAFYHFLAYLGTFIIELVKANINMLAYVYAPSIGIRPGIVRVRTRLTSPIGRLALANSIALTPGSLVLDLKGDTFYIHWLDVMTTDADEAAAILVDPFERHLEKVFG